MKVTMIKTLLFIWLMLAASGFHASFAEAECIPMGDDLSMTICAEYQSAQYQFTLHFVAGASELYWKMDISTFKQIQVGTGLCNFLHDDLAIRICCVQYAGYHCGFLLQYALRSEDPYGFYWKMDLATFAANPVGVDDPLSSFQWHLCNSGQNSFSSGRGKPGEDMRMSQAMAERRTGEGIIVAVVDSGLEIAHEDIAGNIIPNGSYNYVNHTTDPTSMKTDGDHGTSVAGIIAALSVNGKGGRGVSPRASLKGFNPLATQSEQDFIESLGLHPRSQNVDIFNLSYGDEGMSYVPLPPLGNDLYESTHALRGGKGSIYVKSAGNEFASFEIETPEGKKAYICSEQPGGVQNLTCLNAAAFEEHARPELVVVGAYNAAGVKSSYSTAGSTLWISAPGGEYGVDYPAMITIDQSGCDKGYSRYGLVQPSNSFEVGDPTYNPNCNYTSCFNGTSSAAPSATGAIALFLQANPNLTRRDVKHILAGTARKIDPGSAGSIVTVSINGTPYEASQGWITNGGGYSFHNWYGFGAVNVDAALAMAKEYQANSLPPLQNRSYACPIAGPEAIPDNNASGVTKAVEVSEDLTIENLFVKVCVDHPDTSQTGIEITSPQGTKSILLNIRSGVKEGLGDEAGVVFGSNAFYGEKAKGTWTLRVLDSLPEKTGTLKRFDLRILGY